MDPNQSNSNTPNMWHSTQSYTPEQIAYYQAYAQQQQNFYNSMYNQQQQPSAATSTPPNPYMNMNYYPYQQYYYHPYQTSMVGFGGYWTGDQRVNWIYIIFWVNRCPMVSLLPLRI